MKKKTVAILSFSDLERDPRIDRQIRFLGDAYEVTAVGYGNPSAWRCRGIGIARPAKTLSWKIRTALRLLAGHYERHYWGESHIAEALDRLSGRRFDLLIANDIETLPLALRIAGGAKILFDAHEYAPREFEDLFVWRLFFLRYVKYLCDTYIPKADVTTTVCQGIAEAYEADTGIRPVVITNAAFYEDLQPDPGSVETESIRLIHHGAAMVSRNIETMIRMMDSLDSRFELNLMLVDGTPGYLEKLKTIARGRRSVRFLEPVPVSEIPRALNRFDVGLFLLEPVNFNYLHALPNKIFEFIQGRLAIAVGPSPEMARIVEEYGLGVVAEDFSPRTMASSLRRLDRAAIDRFKRRSHEAARELSAERNREKFLGLVEKALAG